MNSNYKANKAKAIYINNTPTMTDQSQAEDTNVNVIMKKYRITGVVPGAAKAPIFADFTELPTSLQQLMEEAQRLPEHLNNLPDQLKGMPLDELVNLTGADLQAILRPKAPTPTQQENKPTSAQPVTTPLDNKPTDDKK